MNFLKPAKYFFILSAVTAAASLILLIVPGPRLSIEFTGGTRAEFSVPAGTTAEKVRSALAAFDHDIGASVNMLQSGNALIRSRGLDEAMHAALLTHLQTSLGDIKEVQYTTIGPTVGTTLKHRAVVALLVASLGIILYLAWAFRKIPRRASPWRFGIIAVVTLLHDILVTVGIFVVLSRITSMEFDTLFVTALLTILGYSVNDTIIVFDRIRDNLFLSTRSETFAELANTSVNQTWKRSCYTSVSTLIMLVAVLLLGSPATFWFLLTLVVGITLGTYSSIFVAMPMLVYWHEWSNRRR